MVRRFLVGSALIGLTTAGLAALAPPASAIPWNGLIVPAILASYSGTGCSVTPPGPGASEAIVSNTPVSFGAAGSATGTGPIAEDSGVMGGSVEGAAYFAESGGDASSFDVSARVKLETKRDLGDGSACSATSTGVFTIETFFSLSEPRILVLDLSVLGRGHTQYNLIMTHLTSGGMTGMVPNISGAERSQKTVLRLPAGVWQIHGQFTVSASSEASIATADNRLRLRGEFKPLGAADGAADGAGAKYVTLADGQNCATNSLTADFTKKAGNGGTKPKKSQGKGKGKAKKRKPVIKKATFYVNGVKVRTVKKPTNRTRTTIRNLPLRKKTTVSVQLKLPGKGVATVERTYLPCA